MWFKHALAFVAGVAAAAVCIVVIMWVEVRAANA
jgi:hypothetical protein